MRPNEIGDGSLGRKGVELHKDRGRSMTTFGSLFKTYRAVGSKRGSYSSLAGSIDCWSNCVTVNVRFTQRTPMPLREEPKYDCRSLTATLFWSYSWPGPRHPPRYSAFALNSTTELPLQTSDLTSDREHDTIA
ncbi:hypothetical protein M0802_005201 [Mischocyttarus mexicanus]|nr:hypothetical protein M0802_013844 [Mischocyttarus mexicanus]KAI4499631.1 hypothetical protein M0802_005201 [Mischocyttarus mexicanus]